MQKEEVQGITEQTNCVHIMCKSKIWKQSYWNTKDFGGKPLNIQEQ